VKNPISYLAYWAKIHPEKAAIQNTVSRFSYCDLFDRVCRISAKLKARGVKPQQKVVLSMCEDHFRWIFSLALLHAGVTLISYESFNPSDYKDDESYEWIVSDKTIAIGEDENLILIDHAWLLSVKDSLLDLNFYEYTDNDLIAIFTTSGSTGQAKKVAWHLNHLELRAKSEIFNTGASGKITTMSSAGNLGFYVGFSCFVFGETLFTQASNEEIIELVIKNDIKTIHGSPAQISSLIKTLIEKSPNDLMGRIDKIITAGSIASKSLLENIHKYFGASLFSDYGSTETGFACRSLVTSFADLNVIGIPAPEVLIQAVDDKGNELSFDEIGKVRIKTPYMVNSYLNNKQESDIFFSDGWFYPGDLGSINRQGELTINGRWSEVINLGGVKINKFLLDLFFLKYPGVRDAAVFTHENEIGLDELIVAIVSDEKLDIDTLIEKLIKEHGSAFCPKRFFRAHQIPRNTNGKVMREELAKGIINMGKY